LPIDRPIVLTDEIDPLVEQMNLETSMLDSFSLEKNIDYKMLTTRESLMKLNMQVQMAAFLPSLSGYFNRHEDFDNNFFNNSSPNMYGLSLNFPLWSSGQRMSRIGQTRLEYLKAQTDREMAAESLQIQYESSLSGFLSANDVYQLQKENRDLAFRIYQSSLIKYKEGIGSSLDLNQTQSQYFEAESSYFGAVIALVTAKSTLESLLKLNVLP
jgi:outer membrane protein